MDKLVWFNGNEAALDFYERLVFVAHTWDDLIDKDKPVADVNLNALVANLLLYLPNNAFYRAHEEALRAHLFSAMAGFQAANLMEQSGDAHKLEIAHFLRYLLISVVTFMFVVIHGIDGAAKLLAEVAPVMIPERIADYIKEHDHATQP